MKFQTRSETPPDISLTPLIDVVFLMLIFFMVSTTFNREAELHIDLPEASAAPSAEQPSQVLEIVVDREGRYFLDGQELVNREAATLRAVLAKRAGDHTDQPLVISADAAAPYQAVIRAMDVAGQLGLNNLSLTTKQAPEGH